MPQPPGALLALGPVTAAARPAVGLLLKVRSTEGFWAEVEKGAREAAEAAGVDLIVKGTGDVANSGAQLKLLESLVNQKIDVLVVSPTNPERLLAPLAAEAAKGLKIVIARRRTPGEHLLSLRRLRSNQTGARGGDGLRLLAQRKR